jgi:1,4-alpha-glucan branching enzyme
LIWSSPSSLHLSPVSPPAMSSSIESSNYPTDGTGKLIGSLVCGRKVYSNAFPGVIQLDPWLEPHRDVLKHRFQVVETWAKTINETEGGLDKFSKVN